MEKLKITEDLSSLFPIESVYIKRDELQQFFKGHGHSHGGKPCDGNHGHSHEEKSHGHSHENKSHGHSHSQNESKSHGHSHGGKPCDGNHGQSHGHSHESKSHGHSHEEKSHGHSHESKSHGHSHEKTNSHGHSHSQNEGNESHGHSHGGKPCDGNHKTPLIFHLLKLSTTTFLNVSKLKIYLSTEKKKSCFEEWWKKQIENKTAKEKLEKRIQFVIESVKETEEIEETELKQLAPELFDLPQLLGEKKEGEKEGNLLTMISDFVDLYDHTKKMVDGMGSQLIHTYVKIMCFCPIVIPLIEEATEEPLIITKAIKKSFNKKCEKHQERFHVNPYTFEWQCFQCFPSLEDAKIANTFFSLQNQLRQSIAHVSGVESICDDPTCKHCLSFALYGLHESRGMIRALSKNNDVSFFFFFTFFFFFLTFFFFFFEDHLCWMRKTNR